MGSMYSAHVELARKRISEDQAGAFLDHLEQFHGAVGISPGGHVDAQISVEASTIGQAATVAALVVQDAATSAGMHSGTTAIAVEVMTEDLWNVRQGWDDEPAASEQPSVIGSDEVSKILGVSRQRVMQLVDEGRLTSIPVGARAHGFIRGDVVKLAQDRGRMVGVLDPDDRAGRQV